MVDSTIIRTLKAATVFVAAAGPAFAQGTASGTADTGASDQTLAQERAVSQGVPLFISPADVRLIQQTLNSNGYEAGDVNGQSTDATTTALCNFQQAQTLEPTGNLNPQTLAALGLANTLTGGNAGQSDQTIAQETSVGQGAPLFVSPATVRQIEQALNDGGYNAGNIDGVWDQGLQTALANYEQAQGMEPTGTITLAAITSLGLSFSSGGQQQGQGGNQTLSQEASVISPEDCVASGRASVQAALASGGQGTQTATAMGSGGEQSGGGSATQTADAAEGAQETDSTATGAIASGNGTAEGGQAGGGQSASGAGSQSGTQLYLSPAAVRQIEQALNAAGYDSGAVDGLWDDNLQTALANYQQAQGLEPTGNLNTRVIAALGASVGLRSQGQSGGQDLGTTGVQGGSQNLGNESTGDSQ